MKTHDLKEEFNRLLFSVRRSVRYHIVYAPHRSRRFGIEMSPSFVREPEGNGVAERFIRTLKENQLWVRSFETIEELRLALLAFTRTYNEHWMLEKYTYRSPAQVRRDLVGLVPREKRPLVP